MSWHPHTERPDNAPTTAVLADRDDDGEPFILAIYIWDGDNWRAEDDDRAPPAVYWWQLETDLLRGLPT